MQILLGGLKLIMEGTYSLVNDVPPVEFHPSTLLESLKKDNVVALKKNADYYLSMAVIPHDIRNVACLQILEDWYRHGKSEDEVRGLFATVLSTKIENYEEFLLEYDIGYHYARARSKAEDVSPDGKEDKLVLAKRNYYYVMAKDLIYDATTRMAYPRATFKYCIDNKYTYEIDGEIRHGSLIDIWLANPDAKKAVSTGWQPNETTAFEHNGMTLVNTYRNNRPLAAAIPSQKLIDMWLAVIDNVFMGEKKLIAIYISSVKWQIEHSLEPRTWSTTIVGTKGPGKGTLWKTLCALLGNGMDVDPQHLKKEYNTFLFNHETLLFNEMDTQGSHSLLTGIRYGALKSYITENEHTRTGKGKDADDFSLPTYYSVEMHANSITGLKFERNDRRHYLIYCTAESLHDRYGKQFLTDYYAALESGELGASLMAYLASYTYSPDFDYTTPYKTRWYDDLCDASKSDISRDIIDALDQDNLFGKSDIQTIGTLRQMLITLMDYPEAKTTSGKVGRAVNELVADGRFKIVQERASLPYKLVTSYNGIERQKGRMNTKLIAIRDLHKYMAPEDAKKALYPHIQ